MHRAKYVSVMPLGAGTQPATSTEDANPDMPEYASQTAPMTPVRKALMRLGRLSLSRKMLTPSLMANANPASS